MSYRIAILILLCSASLPLFASEENVASPDGGGDCASVMAPEAPGDGPEIDRSREAEAAAGGKDSAERRGGNAENSLRGPRMHNLLPGMFR